MASLFTLDISGTLLAVLFGILVIYFGLNFWWYLIAVLIDFLVLSSLVTKAGDQEKSKIKGYEKVRSWKNVAANGLVPVLITLIYYIDVIYQFFPANILIFAFVASVAAITADKFSSEFGVLDGEPVYLLTMKKGRRGASGAVTWFGTLMGLVASLLVSFTYFAIGSSILIFAVIFISGAFGNVVDSVFGYFEEKGIGSKYTSNLLCSFAGALLCALLLYFIV